MNIVFSKSHAFILIKREEKKTISFTKYKVIVSNCCWFFTSGCQLFMSFRYIKLLQKYINKPGNISY